jgi:hypothetical protein
MGGTDPPEQEEAISTEIISGASEFEKCNG